MEHTEFSRRSALALALSAAATFAMGAEQSPPRPPALAPEQVRDFVIAGHHDLDQVRTMLDAQSGLLNACWDWGAGDFETALEGAGHMGNREIALYLIGKGARQNIFQAAMLGDIETVKSMIAAHPALRTSKGPHGIPLVAHAEKGGPEAAAVLDFLRSFA